MRTRLLAVLVVVLMAVTACGSSGGGGLSGNDAKAAKSLATEFQQGGTGSFTLTRKQATCAANSLVSKIGSAQLQRYGILTKNYTANKSVNGVKMNATDADAAATALTSCTNMQQLIKKAMGSATSLSGKAAQCVDKVLTPKTVHDLLKSLFMGQQSAIQQSLTKSITKCALGGG